MFDNLRKTFSGLSKKLAEKDLTESDIDDILTDMEMSLLQSDVALEAIEEICTDLKKRLTGVSVNKKESEEFIRGAMMESVSALFRDTGGLDVVSLIREKNSLGDPFIVVFLGINGTGKTTTLAKFAYYLKQHGISTVLAAADTFRAGAIEQIREHADRLHVKLVAQNYNSDPAAVAKDAAMYAKSHHIDCVLVDTAGRIQTSVNLMQQIEKITKVVRPDLKIFVGDSLAGNDAVSQAREFYEYTKFDGSILTKSDADAKGGAALSITKMTSKPVLFLGVGQEYPDLRPFKRELFLDTLFGSRPDMGAQMDAKIKDALKRSPALETDPLDGLDTKDIEMYSDLHGISPPDNDDDARDLADKIHAWIKDGRPEPPPEPAPDKAPSEPAPDHTLSESAPDPAPQPESAPEPEPEPMLKPDPEPPLDPFHGIPSEDISNYSDLHDILPPDNDDDARDLADKIHAWIKDGRPEPPPEPAPDKAPSEPAPDQTPSESAPDPEPRPESAPEPEPGPMIKPDPEPPLDPFHGISSEDISNYSDLHDILPPDNDDDARDLADKIHAWIKDGRPEPPPEPALDKAPSEPAPDQTPESAPDPEPRPESAPEPEPEPMIKPDPEPPLDPFHGISSEDISNYSDLHDILPPDNDDDARHLADKIHAWIKDGRPEPPPESAPDPEPPLDPFHGISSEDISNYSDLHDILPPDNDDDARDLADKIHAWIKDGRPKPKKRRGLFGMFKR